MSLSKISQQSGTSASRQSNPISNPLPNSNQSTLYDRFLKPSSAGIAGAAGGVILYALSRKLIPEDDDNDKNKKVSPWMDALGAVASGMAGYGIGNAASAGIRSMSNNATDESHKISRLGFARNVFDTLGTGWALTNGVMRGGPKGTSALRALRTSIPATAENSLFNPPVINKLVSAIKTKPGKAGLLGKYEKGVNIGKIGVAGVAHALALLGLVDTSYRAVSSVSSGSLGRYISAISGNNK